MKKLLVIIRSLAIVGLILLATPAQVFANDHIVTSKCSDSVGNNNGAESSVEKPEYIARPTTKKSSKAPIMIGLVASVAFHYGLITNGNTISDYFSTFSFDETAKNEVVNAAPAIKKNQSKAPPAEDLKSREAAEQAKVTAAAELKKKQDAEQADIVAAAELKKKQDAEQADIVAAAELKKKQDAEQADIVAAAELKKKLDAEQAEVVAAAELKKKQDAEQAEDIARQELAGGQLKLSNEEILPKEQVPVLEEVALPAEAITTRVVDSVSGEVANILEYPNFGETIHKKRMSTTAVVGFRFNKIGRIVDVRIVESIGERELVDKRGVPTGDVKVRYGGYSVLNNDALKTVEAIAQTYVLPSELLSELKLSGYPGYTKEFGIPMEYSWEPYQK